MSKLKGAPLLHAGPIPKIRPAATSNKRYIVLRGGRGSGKSYQAADILIHRALMYPGVRILCVKETLNSLEDSSLEMLKRVILDRGYGKMFTMTRKGLETIWGSRFIFRGMQQPNRIRSLTNIKYAWVEEAQDLTQDAWDILRPTVREPRSQIFITYNRELPTDPVDVMFPDTRTEDALVIEVNWDDNPHFPEVLEAEKDWDYKTDPEKADWIWGGNYRQISKGLVFAGKFKVWDFETPKDAQFYFGADWGFSDDPNALIRMYVDKGDLWIDQEAYALNVDLDDLEELWDTVPESRLWRIRADSARPDTIRFMKKRKFRVTGAIKGPGSVEDGIEFIKGFGKVHIHSRCRHTADEFKTYSYKLDRLTGEPTPRLEDKNNHAIDSIRYALELVRRPRGQVKIKEHI